MLTAAFCPRLLPLQIMSTEGQKQQNKLFQVLKQGNDALQQLQKEVRGRTGLAGPGDRGRQLHGVRSTPRRRAMPWAGSTAATAASLELPDALPMAMAIYGMNTTNTHRSTLSHPQPMCAVPLPVRSLPQT